MARDNIGIALSRTVYETEVTALVVAISEAYTISVHIEPLVTPSGQKTDWRVLFVPRSHVDRVEAFMRGWKARGHSVMGARS